ncbi:MAG: bifunctional riboflavin kinase/FAD synthetase [Lachnospiraceae bacterium]|nr:bifunctional riboflavin kinase/FAD synthetase [Lachnospiraceae bacterium]
MKLIQGTTEFELDRESAVAIGKFDGVHLGHQKLLQQILDWKKEGLQAVIFTFDPPPAVFFQQTTKKELTTQVEKRKLFEQMGIDVLIEFPLNMNTAATRPINFIEQILVRRIKAKKIAAGTDLSFGYRGAGNCELLQSKANEYDFEVKIIDKVCLNGREISSTYVREEVEKGDMELVTTLMGSPYSVHGIVQHGQKLGRTIDMPTVNLLPIADKLLPPRGVYFSYIYYGGQRWYGVTNIGCRPTVSANEVISVETYIYGFDEEIYGEDIAVALLHYRRPEMKFANVEELKNQMQQDREAGRAYFA